MTGFGDTSEAASHCTQVTVDFIYILNRQSFSRILKLQICTLHFLLDFRVELSHRLFCKHSRQTLHALSLSLPSSNNLSTACTIHRLPPPSAPPTNFLSRRLHRKFVSSFAQTFALFVKPSLTKLSARYPCSVLRRRMRTLHHCQFPTPLYFAVCLKRSVSQTYVRAGCSSNRLFSYILHRRLVRGVCLTPASMTNVCSSPSLL